MTVLALRLAGPLQSWGVDSKFTRRRTGTEPSKSGVVGLLAAASGLRRTDPLEHLLSLRLGVRVDQPGQVVKDFQTEIRRETSRSGDVTAKAMPLSYRYYLGDAVFLAMLEGPAPLLEGLEEALRRPAFPLFLGRRSCPPAGPVTLGLREGSLEQRLQDWAWLASRHEMRRHREPVVDLSITCDAQAGAPTDDTVHDQPVSFDPRRRVYAWRRVVRGSVQVVNPLVTGTAVADRHDPLLAAGG